MIENPIDRLCKWAVRRAGALRIIVLSFALCAGSILAGPTNAPPSKQTLMVAMRDGVKLATDVYSPATNGSWPVILARTPYNKVLGAGFATQGVTREFVVVVQDVRGRFASEGENLAFDRDMPDGFDTIEWVAKQPWCNGRIGTWGGSAGAITQLQLAGSGTDKLACQHLVVGGPSLYHDVVYSGGVFRKALVEDWLRVSQFSPEALKLWVGHPDYDDYWRERDVTQKYGRIDAPAVHIGGYWDIFAQGTVDAFLGYQTKGGPHARNRQKLVMGPWTHGVLQEKAGELAFPNAKKPPGKIDDAWLWFSHCLKDADNGIDRAPAVTYYVIGDVFATNAPGNEWRTGNTWPPLETKPREYYFHPDHSLSGELPLAHSTIAINYDPKNPAPTVGGLQLTIPAGPMDQKKIEQREDVLVFTGALLAEPLEICGQVRARLWISSDAPDTDFFVKLCDVYPDGRSFNICEGCLRTRFRGGFSKETPIQAGQVYALDIGLSPTSIIFNRGHRLRVQVTSSSAPGYDPNPNTGEPFRSSDHVQIASNSVYVASGRASHMVLPVVTRAP
jgi:predicted acyl esterase